MFRLAANIYGCIFLAVFVVISIALVVFLVNQPRKAPGKAAPEKIEHIKDW
jgi:hypothetical protein